MKSITLAGAILMLSGFASAAATANPARNGALPVQANRIVGLWGTERLVGPCGGTPVNQIRNTLLFHAGGTVVENPRFPPAGFPDVAGVPGVYQRGQALGTRTYDPQRHKYWIHLRFDNFVDSVYHGCSTVARPLIAKCR